MRLLCYLDDWLGSSAAASRTAASVVRGSGDRRKLGEVGPPAVCRVQYLGMLIDTSFLRVFPSQAGVARFREVATTSASVAPSTDVAAAAGPHGVAGTHSSQESHRYPSPPVPTQGPLVSHGS